MIVKIALEDFAHWCKQALLMLYSLIFKCEPAHDLRNYDLVVLKNTGLVD